MQIRRALPFSKHFSYKFCDLALKWSADSAFPCTLAKTGRQATWLSMFTVSTGYNLELTNFFISLLLLGRDKFVFYRFKKWPLRGQSRGIHFSPKEKFIFQCCFSGLLLNGILRILMLEKTFLIYCSVNLIIKTEGDESWGSSETDINCFLGTVSIIYRTFYWKKKPWNIK